MQKETRRNCSQCAKEKTSNFCDCCKKVTQTNEGVEFFSINHRIKGLFKIKYKYENKLTKIISFGRKRSGDIKIKDGVYEDRIISKIDNEYHQIITDCDSGVILHEEHEALTNHSKFKKV